MTFSTAVEGGTVDNDTRETTVNSQEMNSKSSPNFDVVLPVSEHAQSLNCQAISSIQFFYMQLLLVKKHDFWLIFVFHMFSRSKN